MPDVFLVGGPYDGKKYDITFSGLKAPMHGYGWTHSCGHDTFAIGWYDENGTWEHPERNLSVDYECARCWKRKDDE